MKTCSRLVLVLALFFILGRSSSAAAETSPVTDGAISLAPTEEITATDLEVPEPKAWNLWGSYVQLFLTRNEEKRAAIIEKLTDMELVKAVEAHKAKKTKTAERAYEKFTQNQARLEKLLGQTENDQVKTKIEARIAKNEILYTAMLDKLAANGATFQTKIEANRAAMLKDVAKKLNVLSDEDAKKKVKEATDLLEKKEKAKDKKYDKSLAVLESLDQAKSENEADGADASDDDALAKALKAKQDEVVAKLAGEDPEVAKKLAANFDEKRQRHLLVLEEVYNKAPDAAKPALQKAIDQQTEKLVEKSQKNSGLMSEILGSKKIDEATEKKIREQVELKAKEKKINLDEALKQASEEKAAREKKIEAAKTEKAKKLEEAAKEKAKEKIEKTKESIKNKAIEIKEKAAGIVE